MSFFQSQNDYSNYLTNISNQAQNLSNTYGSSYADMLNQTESAQSLYQNSQIETKQLNAQGLDDLLFSAPLFHDTLKPLIERAKTSYDYLNTALDKAKGTVSNVEELVRRAQKLKDSRNIINTSSSNGEVKNAIYDPLNLEELPTSLSGTTTDLALQAKKDFILSNSNNDPNVLTKVINGTDKEVEDLYKTTLEKAPIGPKNVSPMEGIRYGDMAQLRPDTTGSAFKELTSGEKLADKLLKSPEGQKITDALNQFKLRNVETNVGEIKNRAYEPNQMSNEAEIKNEFFNPNELGSTTVIPEKQLIEKSKIPSENTLDSLMPELQATTNKANELAESLKESVSSGSKQLQELVSSKIPTGQETKSFFKGIAEDIPLTTDSFENTFKTLSAGDKLANLMSNPRSQKVKSVFGDVYNYLSGESMVPVLPNPRQLLTGGENLLSSAKTTGENLLSTAKEGVQSAMTTGEGLVSSAKQGVESVMASGGEIANSAQETLQSATSNLSEAIKPLTDAIPKIPNSVTSLSSESDVGDFVSAAKDVGSALIKDESIGGAVFDTLGEVGQIALGGYSIYQGIKDFIQGKSAQPAPQQQVQAPVMQTTVGFTHQAGVY